MTAHGVDLVNKDNTRRVLLGLLEHVADAACTNTDEHLDKIRPGDGEERHTGLTRDRARQQRLTRARRAHQQRAFGDLATETGEFLRVAQEFHDLFQLFLGLVDASDIVKGHATMLLGQHLGLGLAKAHGTAFATALHAVHEIDPDTDQQQERQKSQQERLEGRLLLFFRAHGNVVVDQHLGDFGVSRLDRGVALAIGSRVANLFAIQRHSADVSTVNGGHEFRISLLAAL